MNWKKKTKRPAAPAGAGAVARLQEQVRTAKEMAAIPQLELLEAAGTNPAARGRAEELRDARHVRELEMGHARALRELRVADRRESAAERAEAAVLQAREADSPALSVLALTRTRTRGAAVALGASIALSVGSALGLEALAQSWAAPAGVGYLAEIGLTGLSTAAIVWRGSLARHRARLAAWQEATLAALITVPLLVSIVGSTAGSGPVGAATSLGAAAFALLSYLISVTASAAIQHQITRLDHDRPDTTTASSGGTAAEAAGRDEALQEAVRAAVQAELTAAPPRPPDGRDLAPMGEEDRVPGVPEVDGWTLGEVEEAVVQAEADDGVSALEDHLRASARMERSHGPSERSHGPDDGPVEGDGDAEDGGEDGGSGPVAVCERPGGPGAGGPRSHGPAERLTAAEKKRREGLRNRERIAEFLRERPDARSPEIAARTGLGESTVRRLLRELRAEDGGAS